MVNTALIRNNKRILQNYCRLRHQSAYDLNRETAAVAFDIIPVLLSLNHASLPGFVPAADKACGVYRVGTSKKLHKVIENYFPEARNKKIPYQRFLIQRPIIESLFIMGSTGTVSQKNASDFDFWVCVDASRFSDANIDKLHTKTEKISKWCQSTFDMEVHFFIMDVEQIRNNDFGKADEDSAGSSQKKFLKEEFYRTFLLVAGKVPFWWVVPSGIDRQSYETSWNEWIKKGLYDRDNFVDLGFLDDVSRDEFLGTTLWNLSKGLKDPFKALIKMTMMEWYLSDSFDGRLLCDVLKERVLEGSKPLKDLDPYILMVETALAFFEQQDRQEHIELLRKAFYIKSDPGITRTRLKRMAGNYQVDVFETLMKDWQWSLDTVEDLNQMRNWSYARHLKLASEINQFFFSTYRRLRKTFDLSKRQKINDRDLTLMGRKLSGLFAKRKGKLHITPFLTKERPALQKCIFRFDPRKSGKTRWLIYDATPYPFEEDGRKFLIHSANRVAEAATWLIINDLYDARRTMVDMPPNASGLNINDLMELLKHLQYYFSPAVHQGGTDANFQEDATYSQIMVIVDLVGDPEEMETANLDLVLKNTWGEIFVETYPYQEGLQVAKQHIADLSVENDSEAAEKVKIHAPRSAKSERIKKTIYQEILQER